MKMWMQFNVQGMTLNCIHIFIVTGSFLYWCVMRPASQRFFIHSCIHLRILIIPYLATFLGTKSLSVLMCRKAVNQSTINIGQLMINAVTWCVRLSHTTFDMWLVVWYVSRAQPLWSLQWRLQSSLCSIFLISGRCWLSLPFGNASWQEQAILHHWWVEHRHILKYVQFLIT